jgi:hypothetical protein
MSPLFKKVCTLFGTPAAPPAAPPQRRRVLPRTRCPVCDEPAVVDLPPLFFSDGRRFLNCHCYRCDLWWASSDAPDSPPVFVPNTVH